MLAMAQYWASCSSGLQFALIAELQQLDCICIVSDSLIFGGVLFSTLSTPAEILKLRSADNVYAFIGKFEVSFSCCRMNIFTIRLSFD